MAKIRVPNIAKGVRPTKIGKEKQNIFLIFLFVIINAFVIVLFYKSNLVALILTLVLGILFILNYRSNVLIAVFVLGMLAAFLEMLVVSYGVWSYANPSFANIPAWSFVLWVNISIAIYRVAVEFERIGFHK